MLAVSPQTRVFVACEPVDFRCGIDRLAQTCRAVLDTDPMSGIVFVFKNRKGTSIKVLTYDGQGFWLCQKRLSKGKFKYWPSGQGAAKRSLFWYQLSVLVSGGDPTRIKAVPQWRPIA